MGYFIDSDERDYLSHYGTLTYSGRYRWGSGEDPYQRLNKFLKGVQTMKQEGYKESDIAKAFGLSTSADLRSMITVSKYDKSYLDHVRVVSLRVQGVAGSKDPRPQLPRPSAEIRSRHGIHACPD